MDRKRERKGRRICDIPTYKIPYGDKGRDGVTECEAQQRLAAAAITHLSLGRVLRYIHNLDRLTREKRSGWERGGWGDGEREVVAWSCGLGHYYEESEVFFFLFDTCIARPIFYDELLLFFPVCFWM